MEQMIMRAKQWKAAAEEAIASVLSGSMLLTSLLSGACAALLAVYSPAAGVAPFGIGCAVGVWYAGVSPYFAFAGAFFVYLIKAEFAHAAACIILCAFVLIADRFFSVRRVYRLLIGFAAEASVLCLSAALKRTAGLTALGSSSVSILCAVILGHAVNAAGLLPARNELADTDLLSLAASAGLITLSFGNHAFLGVSPAMVFAGVCALISAHRFGIASVAFVVAIGAGRAMVTGGDMHFMAIIAVTTLIAATLGSLGKWAIITGFAAINILFRLFMNGTSLFSIPETLLSSVLFILLPASVYMPSSTEKEPAATYSTDTKYSMLQYRISGLAEVLRELARVFGSDGGHMLSCISDTLQRTVGGRSNHSRTKYGIMSGAAASKREGSTRSGDNWCIRSFEGSQLLCVSDGMGSGEAAFMESRETLALLNDLIAVGFDMRSAADCINKLLLKRAANDMYATLDAMLIDLDDCSAEMLKLGAPPTYVLRGGRLFSLYAENLPVGIIEDADPPVKRIGLKSGDIIVMMTDGAADALGSDLIAVISDIMSMTSDIDEGTREILAAARRKGGSDDMTVLAAKIA